MSLVTRYCINAAMCFEPSRFRIPSIPVAVGLVDTEFDGVVFSFAVAQLHQELHGFGTALPSPSSGVGAGTAGTKSPAPFPFQSNRREDLFVQLLAPDSLHRKIGFVIAPIFSGANNPSLLALLKSDLDFKVGHIGAFTHKQSSHDIYRFHEREK
jgi:hypothetical protein